MSVRESSVLEFFPLHEEHLEAIMAIEVEAYPEPWTLRMFQDEIRMARSYFYVGFLGEELAVYGGFWLVVDEAHITSVAVKDVYRGRGLGRKLMDHLLDEAEIIGATRATLEVRVSNQVARSLYVSLGFRPVGIRKGYYPKNNEDAVVMLKDFD
ncbi:MAG: ribosomal protein S18-alanine N-acetyltransferase [FCB group bacterium]|jgi:ribosomal-protein-alanine N-acetyltransferase|nr:ribosomal protein S18-alanine N-acetyltransferase [FCB group bacterium]